MDDYNIDILSQAKSEYSANLVNIITPLIIEGFKSIFKEAWQLCITNDEDSKYLMTFQNFLTRVPKWNQSIIEDEKNRILDKSKCTYLEDLLTCVYITQLKILTSIRVSSKQKKIDIDIPKLSEFIHKVYIASARKIYSNVYLFEEEILPLQKQKNMRECELICKECLLNVIRESMPVEKILRAYLDETTEEEVIEEKVTEVIDSKKEEIEKAAVETSSADIKKELETTVQKKDLSTTENKILKELNNDIKQETPNLTLATHEINNISRVASAPVIINTTPTTHTSSPVKTLPIVITKPSNISFNDSDEVMNYNVVQSPKTITKTIPDNVLAPKTVDRLEEISKSRHEQRKIEEAEEEEEEDKLTIHDDAPSLKLDSLDINDIGDKLSLKNEIMHDVIELK
jgi:hypothetical protein